MQNTVAKRRVMPAFMLPADFPNPLRTEIYSVYHDNDISNVRVCSAQEFLYDNPTITDWDPTITDWGKRKQGTLLQYRCDSLDQTLPFLEKLASLNNATLDWSLVLYQGQLLSKRISDFLGIIYARELDSIIRITPDGAIIVSRGGVPVQGYEAALPPKITTQKVELPPRACYKITC